jgi:predicted nucleotidyltransferase
MIALIEQKREAIEVLCRQYRVHRLELFGSATGEVFDPETSDVDFLVEFQELPPGERADAYFGLLEGLQELFQREVDLVTVSAVTNPYLRESIEQSKALLYAA